MVRVERQINYPLLYRTVLAAVIVGVVGYFWHQHRADSLSTAFEQRAAALEKEGQWREAAHYLRRYLQLQPQDMEARVRLLDVTEQASKTPAQKRQLVGMLYHLLGQLPERYDLQLRLVTLLWETGELSRYGPDYARAEVEANNLVKALGNKSPDSKEYRAAQRIRALAMHRRARPGVPVGVEEAANAGASKKQPEGRTPGAPVSIQEAANKLIEVYNVNPTDVAVAVALAGIYQEYPDDVRIDNPKSEADQLIDQLIEADPSNIDARIARYHYRQRYKAGENARSDLEAVLSQDPNHIEALLLLAYEEMASSNNQDFTAAERKLRKVIELRATEPRGYMNLARLQIANGDRNQALETLQRGRKQLATRSLDLDAILIDTLIDLNKLDDAAQMLTDFDSEIRRILPELPANRRTSLENVGRLLRGQLNFAQKDFHSVIRELSALIASVEGQADENKPQELLQARIMLAAAQERVGSLDLAVAHWNVLSGLGPQYVEFRRLAGGAYLQLGRPKEAIRELEAYLQAPNASPVARIVLVEAHLQQQLLLPKEERAWDELERQLSRAKASPLPPSWELPLVEALYKHAKGEGNSGTEALDLLRPLEKAYPKNVQFLERLASCYQRFGAAEDLERILALYDQCQPDPGRRALFRAALHVQQGRDKDAAKILSAIAATDTASARDELQEARIRLLLASRQFAEAHAAVSEFIDASPSDAARLSLGLEIALARQDFATAARWEDALRNLKSTDDFNWRYFRARRLIAQFATLDPASRSELHSLISSLRSQRPDWRPVVAMEGQYADLTGDRSQAIAYYQRAIELGDRRPITIERLVAALYAEGRYHDANNYLALLDTDSQTNGDSRKEALAIAMAYEEGGIEAARERARETIKQGSTNPMHYIWLANLLSRSEMHADRAEAEKVLQEATNRFSNDPRVWNAYFVFLVQAKQLDKARQILEQSTEQLTLEPVHKHFTLAQGYEQLGDLAQAREHYLATIASDAKHIGARLRLGTSLLSSDIKAARQQFEDALRIDPQNAQARRSLAATLAASGDEADWANALRLLESGEASNGSDEAYADDRVRAILLSRRGRNRSDRLKNCQTALSILLRRVGLSSDSSADLDRLLVAGLYEQEAAMLSEPDDVRQAVLSAREVLRPLVDRSEPSRESLVMYVQFLLRNLDRATSAVKDDRARASQRAAIINDVQLRIAELKSQPGDKISPEHLFVPVALHIRALLADNRQEDARQELNKFASEILPTAANDAEKAKLLLRLGSTASSSAFAQEAEGWYRELLAFAPNSYILLAKSLADQKRFNEAVNVCLDAASSRPAAEVATVLTQLVPADGLDPELEKRVERLVVSALKSDRDNVGLLMSVAVRRVTDDNCGEAIKLFRRVLELQPNHTLALNNLATLLAEHPDQLAEARKLAEQAMAVAGRSPALLDTLGTILIRAGKYDDAVASLEHAVAGVTEDPRFYFHLAVAYQRAGRQVDVVKEQLKSARRYGLDDAILTDGDRELLATLERELKK